ncbi:MAG TPA: ATP-binding protein [Longimicrobiales bacterium]|nr:ATP-binding protein [Longimicrobiales bacterium]
MNEGARQAEEERRARRRLAASNETVRVLAESATEAEAMDRLLPALSGALGWQAAALWRVEPGRDELRCTSAWQAELGEPGHSFAEQTASLRLEPGVGLPGRVLERGEPVWLSDVQREENFPRAGAAREAGLHGAFAFPVLVGGRIEAVVEVFTSAREEPDEELLEMMGALGAQLGQFIRRRRAEAALHETESRFRAFTESIAEPAFTIDSASNIVQANPAAERIFGYGEGELLGRSLCDLIPARHREAHQRGVDRYLRTGRRGIPWDGVELPGLRRDGTEVPLEISFGEYERDGEVFFTGVARDVSERLRQQARMEETAAELEAVVEELTARTEEAEAARAEAEEANRAKADFLAVMSHELRTPLNAVLGYVDLILAGIPEPIPEPSTKQLERVRLAARHLLSLIEEILAFSRIEAGREAVREEDADLAELARQAVALVDPLARDQGLELRLRGADEPVPVRTDPPKVLQILHNLLVNAVKFTDEGWVTLELATGEEMAELRVVDTGVGIQPKNQARIFESFWQVERPETRSRGGTGLGLSVSRALAQMLGGDVTVESTPGRGSTFTVTLPLMGGG